MIEAIFQISEELIVIAVAGVIVILGMIAILIVQKKQSTRLSDLLKENYEVGKILVRRDMELSEANARLIALDQSKSEFVSIAAHQLRTPLTGIRWTFNALYSSEFGELNSDQMRMVQSGLKSSIRMIELINDLLNVARIEEGRFGMHFQSQSVMELLEKLLERIRALAKEKAVILTENISPDLPPAVIDQEKMTIALENVLENAVKYTPPGGKVTIDAAQTGEFITITVADSGIGIPKDQMGKVYTKFFRADNALRFQTSGSGLGLYVVKNVMEAHNGNVTLDSQERKGTIVTINFPIKRRTKR